MHVVLFAQPFNFWKLNTGETFFLSKDTQLENLVELAMQPEHSLEKSFARSGNSF